MFKVLGVCDFDETCSELTLWCELSALLIVQFSMSRQNVNMATAAAMHCGLTSITDRISGKSYKTQSAFRARGTSYTYMCALALSLTYCHYHDITVFIH